MTLRADDFEAFYREVHDHDPFPWQTDLVTTALESGWPELVDVPTGLGKTSMIDIAVFVLAATADRPPNRRVGRRRVFFVVDRRLVVDEAHAHATRLSRKVEGAESGVLARVRDALRSLQVSDEALHFEGRLDTGRTPTLTVTRMRGGATWAANWVDRPDQVAVVTGTVDQIGSRFLFRGYGLSSGRMPVDAALTGTDALWLVDEAHLAQPLLETVRAARVLNRGSKSRDAVAPLDVVSLTATASAPLERTYRIDVDAHRGHVVAWRRLTAARSMSLLLTSKATHVSRMVAAALALAERDHRRVLVVCNTVDRAREVHTRLVAVVARAGGPQPSLLIGRSRDLDRRPVVRDVQEHFGIDQDREDGTTRFLVATQTVEVGVNLDAAALVTESASWDALVQRLGRVNRLGLRDRADVLVVHDAVDDGPVYGSARDRCWQHLATLSTVHVDVAEVDWGAGVDVSPLACHGLATDVPAEATLTPSAPPVLLPSTLDSWVQTAPVPSNDTPVGQFLHGFDAPLADLTLVFRSGLFVHVGAEERVGDREAAEMLTALPPRAAEQLTVPFLSVRQWLSSGKAVESSDVESLPWFLEPDPGHQERWVLALRYPMKSTAREESTGERWEWVRPAEIRPGETLVVPVEHGGVDRHGWNPSSVSPVTDLAEAAVLCNPRSTTLTLRVDEHTLQRLGVPDTDDTGRSLHEAWRRWRETALGREAEDTLVSPGRDILAATVASSHGNSWLTGLDAPARQRFRSWLSGPGTDQQDRPSCQLVELADVHSHTYRGQRRRQSGSTRTPSSTWALTGTLPPLTTDAESGPSSTRTPADGTLVDDTSTSSSASPSRAPVTLRQHHTNVAARAEAVATALQLPSDLVQRLAEAAGWHDLGKAESRFQVMLHRGDRLRAEVAVEPLAKSGLASEDPGAWRRAREQSGLPRGARHELWSAALVSQLLGPGEEHELVVHLVASHHGHARPMFWPVVDSQADDEVVVTAPDGTIIRAGLRDTYSLSRVPTFARLNTRYGRWGLALLEAVVRAADVTVSREGS